MYGLAGRAIKQLDASSTSSVSQAISQVQKLSDLGSRQILVELNEIGQSEFTASRVPASTIHSRSNSPLHQHQPQAAPRVAGLEISNTQTADSLVQPSNHANALPEDNNFWGSLNDHNSADLLFWNEMPLGVSRFVITERDLSNQMSPRWITMLGQASTANTLLKSVNSKVLPTIAIFRLHRNLDCLEEKNVLNKRLLLYMLY